MKRIIILYSLWLGMATIAVAQTADFSANVTSGCSPLTVQFTDLSSGATSWSWDFGNTNTSTIQNPGAIYNNPGTYTVTLSINGGASIETKTGYITVFANPQADFSADTTQGCTPFTVNFEDETVLGDTGIANWQWAFGDGSGSNDQHPTYVYQGEGSYSVVLMVTDSNGCTSSNEIPNYVNTSNLTIANSGNDITICGSQSAQLFATGGDTLTWSVISGDPIVIGGNFSCNPCANPEATPAITTTYQVESTGGPCISSDTVTVYIAPDFNITLSQSDTAVCTYEEVSLEAVPDSSGSYTYQWTPGIYLDTATISNPTAIFSSPGNYALSVTVADTGGCVKSGNVGMEVTGYTPFVNPVALDSVICRGDSTALDANPGVYGYCGLSVNPVCTNPGLATIGIHSGENTGSQYPAPYGNSNGSVKQQFLFRASELNAAGYAAGDITQLAWETITQNGATYEFEDYTIKIGCTPVTALSSSWETGLITVFSPKTVNVIYGWNQHELDVHYAWDGTSNLVIEICYDNIANPPTSNWSTPYSATSFISTLHYYSDSTEVCTYSGTGSTGSSRPVTRFGICTETDPGLFDYSWSPAIGLSDTNSFNPLAFPSSTTTYSVTVTDSSGTCSSTANTTITVNGTQSTYSITEPACGVDDGSIAINSSGGAAPYEYSIDGGATFQSGNTFSSLGVGWYEVVISDTADCTEDTLISLINPGAPFIDSLQISDATCANSNNGEIEVFASGGTGFISYSLDSGANYQTSSLFTGLAAGAYWLIVQDSLDCQNLMQVNINAGYVFIDSVTVNHVSCNGAGDGSLIIHASSTGNLMYSIDNGASYQSGNSFSGLPGGNYDIIVMADGICSDSSSAIINEPSPLAVTATATPQITCSGTFTILNADATGGTGNYSYYWSNGSTAATQWFLPVFFTNVYSVTVTDINGCTASDFVIVIVDPPAFLSVSQDTTIHSGDSIEICAYPSGGIALLPYTYQWDDTNNSTTQCIIVAPSDTTIYTVTVGDNCETMNTDSVTVNVIPPLFTDKNSAPEYNFRVFPNPYPDETTVHFILPTDMNIKLTAFNLLGQVTEVLENARIPAGVHSYTFSAKNTGNAAGVYFIRLQADENVWMRKVVEMD